MSVLLVFVYIYNVKHTGIRQRIIETASLLFYRNGYNSTGINEIISESGIAKATLYSHFKSKEDICLSYLQFKNTTFLEDIKVFCTSKPKGKPQLIAIFDFLLSFFKDKDFSGCWCIKTVSEIPKENVKIRAEIQRQKNVFIQWITDLVDDNVKDLNTSQKKTLANRIYLLYESAVAESYLHGSDWPIKEAKDLCSLIIK